MSNIIKQNCTFYSEHVTFFTKRTARVDSGFIHPRLAFICKGGCTCTPFSGKQIELKEGDVWFLPKGKPYVSNWSVDKDGEVEFYFIQFDVDVFSNEYDTFQKFSMPQIRELFCKIYEGGGKLKILSLFYDLLDKVEPFLKKSDSEHYKTVMPALEYLYDNFTSNVKIETLASLCSLSQSRFYTVFKLALGVSPIEYKNGIKLSHAVDMIKSGSTLEDVCDKLGFSSPAFLRRLVKKRFNITPKEIKKVHNI